MNSELGKLRRFALASGLILIVYSLAAVELDTGETIRPLGLPLKINRPEYLGIGLVIATLWGMGRFLYYGVWKSESPWRNRAPLLKRLASSTSKPAFQPADVENYLVGVREVLPRLPGLRITAETRPERLEEESPEDLYRKTQRVVVERVNIPWPFHVAAWIEDIDYFAPIWLNVAALGVWGLRFFNLAHWLPPTS